MATAFGHKWGQEIGDLLEKANRQLLEKVASKHNLYLDFKKKRIARPGLKVTWEDKYGNSHDLDYVLERGGSDVERGQPAAFIESAWRRYTKHSRNKAQEIEGAIAPLAETYSNCRPFLGAILAGDFTEGSLKQLKSKGFSLLYFPYSSVIDAFKIISIDAAFNERTLENTFESKLRAWEATDGKRRQQTIDKLFQLEREGIDSFVAEIEKCLLRTISLIRFNPLHGSVFESKSISDAIKSIQNYEENTTIIGKLVKYEIEVLYNNGDVIKAAFRLRPDAINFLKSYL